MTEAVEANDTMRRPPGLQVRNKILRGSAWVFLGKVLGTIVGIAVNALLARLLTKGEMGTYFQAFSVAMIGSTVATLGMERAIVRMVASSVVSGRPGRARDAIRVAFATGSIAALLVAAVLTFGVGNLLADHVFHSHLLGAAMLAIAGWLIAMTLQMLVAETLRGFKRFWAATLFGGLLVDLFSVAVFGILWLQGAHPSLEVAIMITVGATAAAVLIGAAIVSSRAARLTGRGIAEVGDMLSISLPLMVVSVSSFLVGTGVDIWVVAHFRSASDVAAYGAAARLVFLVATPLIIISQVVPPIIAELYTQGRKHQLERSLRAVATLAGVPAAGVLAVFLVAGPFVMGTIYGDGYRDGATVLAILSIARLYAVFTGSCGVALTMTGHQNTMMRITLFTGVISVASELALVQPFGIVGVAFATCAAQILQNSLQLFYTRRHIGIWTHAEFSLTPFRELFLR